ncbi:MAG TPA: hypothetical protein DCE44_23395, partial [Verrucomicrobiales bacterium]|nr:hypothetical protein [Verrucomicrobiales bacterium]
GAKSSRRPQTLALQLCGLSVSNQPVSDEVLSDLRIQMDKPYYVGASVQFQTDGATRVTFYVKDLSNDEEPLLVTQARTEVSGGVTAEQTLTLGGRPGNQQLWDGLIDDVRLTAGVLAREELELTRDGTTEQTVGLWQFEAKPSYFHDASSHRNDIRPAKAPESTQLDARTLALADLCHALLNANEFLYVE